MPFNYYNFYEVKLKKKILILKFIINEFISLKLKIERGK